LVSLRSFEKVLELGYKRPELVLDREIVVLVDYRFSAGYHTAQQSVPARRGLRPFFDVSAEALFQSESATVELKFPSWRIR